MMYCKFQGKLRLISSFLIFLPVSLVISIFYEVKPEVDRMIDACSSEARFMCSTITWNAYTDIALSGM